MNASASAYPHVSATGHVGPLAVAQPHRMGAALSTALRLAAASGAERLTAFVPDVSDALGVAIAHGMQISRERQMTGGIEQLATVIAAHLREWEQAPAYVERAVFTRRRGAATAMVTASLSDRRPGRLNAS